MTIIEMLGQSGVLTVLGMSVVFGFLAIMVFFISLLGKIINTKEFDDSTAPVAANNTAVLPAPANNNNDAQVTAAITAAVNEHRKGQ